MPDNRAKIALTVKILRHPIRARVELERLTEENDRLRAIIDSTLPRGTNIRVNYLVTSFADNVLN